MIDTLTTVSSRNIETEFLRDDFAGTGDEWMQYLARQKRQLSVQSQASSAQNPQRMQEANATTQAAFDWYAYQVLREIQTLFRTAIHDDFEFGMESDFITSLEVSVEKYGVTAVQAIANIILSDQAKPQVAAEALRWLGDIDHQESYLLRRRLLEKCLSHVSRWVRDGAALGLDAMDDRHAIPYLKAAIAREPNQELRKDINKILVRLEHDA